jgi:hypothetical protein
LGKACIVRNGLDTRLVSEYFCEMPVPPLGKINFDIPFPLRTIVR